MSRLYEINGTNEMENSKDIISKNEILNIAFKYHAEGNIKKASQFYQLFLDRGFLDPRVLNNLGSIYKNLGQRSDAIELFKRSIELFPDFPDPYSNLGNLYIELKNPSEALSLTIKAIQLNPKFAAAYNNLGVILRSLNRLEEAQKFTSIAIELKDDFSDAS